MERLQKEEVEKLRAVEEEEVEEQPLERRMTRERAGPNGAKEDPLEKKIMEWVANLSLGEEEEALMYVTMEEQEAAMKDWNVEEDPLKRQAIEDEKRMEWKLRPMRELKRRVDAVSQAARELEEVKKQGEQMAAQADLLGKMQGLRTELVMQVGSEVKARLENTKRYCVGAIEGARLAAPKEEEARPRREPVKVKCPDSYSGKEEENFDNWEANTKTGILGGGGREEGGGQGEMGDPNGGREGWHTQRDVQRYGGRRRMRGGGKARRDGRSQWRKRGGRRLTGGHQRRSGGGRRSRGGGEELAGGDGGRRRTGGGGGGGEVVETGEERERGRGRRPSHLEVQPFKSRVEGVKSKAGGDRGEVSGDGGEVGRDRVTSEYSVAGLGSRARSQRPFDASRAIEPQPPPALERANGQQVPRQFFYDGPSFQRPRRSRPPAVLPAQWLGSSCDLKTLRPCDDPGRPVRRTVWIAARS
ncbi:hypothetical protein CBR_g38825 [Chara braunii]|uniref:Uncharacterized protein n=1 Tax=Chara braunii TaxID=69332 RepID=A0A388LQP5_CHABU|nr:hypothetical protein CBR_g38825 [Chara braunii]|eukprot:GBG84543.1 hypothetical protein CBR_g38825 [Chara braunii]